MADRKKIPQDVQKELLRQARHRCCLHRLAWLELLPADPSAMKWRALELHHIEFYSRGGSDDIENLIPLCPTCHTIIHSTRVLGRVQIDDEMLRSLWELWVSLGRVVPTGTHVGCGVSVAKVVVSLAAYGLQSCFSVDEAVSFSDARRAIIANTVGILAAEDPHFPFPRVSGRADLWHTSADDVAGTGAWATRTAADVFSNIKEPLTLKAPVIITLNSSPSPYLAGTDEQRTP